jgi:serine protease Do
MKRWFSSLACSLAVLVSSSSAQDSLENSAALSRDLFRGGEATLKAFSSISAKTRGSIVKVNVNGETVALATVVDARGWVLTKASELKPGKLTCWLASEKEVEAEVLKVDEDFDLALIQCKARGLKPVQWANAPVVLGQWAVTPGIASTPQAVGVVSALSRRIRPQRSFIGVLFESANSLRIEELISGLGAEKAGLRTGDKVIAINGESVTRRDEIIDCLAKLREGQTVNVRVQRDQDEFDAQVRLMVPESGSVGERPSRLNGRVSQRLAGFEEVIEHDTVLQPFLCGGPVLDLGGKAIGLNIARAGRVSTYALTPKVVQHALEKLKSAVQRTSEH